MKFFFEEQLILCNISVDFCKYTIISENKETKMIAHFNEMWVVENWVETFGKL